MLDTPYRGTALVIACGLLCATSFFCMELRAVYPSHLLLGLCLAGVVVGYIGMYWSSHLLREDVWNERWSEGTLAPLRQVTGHGLWRVGVVILLLAMLAALQWERHHRVWFWAAFSLVQTQGQLSNIFARPPKLSENGGYLRWSQMSPLRSEHWGER